MKKSSNNKAIGILRKSSKRQDGNSSFDIQEKEIKEYCVREGLHLIGIHEITESAKDSDNRRKYDAVVRIANDADVLHHVYYMQDRESRNLTDNEVNEKRIRRGEIVLHYARDRRLLDRWSPDSDFFARDINAASNKQFSRNLSAKVLDAMKQKAEEGWFPANHVQLGYIHRRMRDQNGKELKGRTEITVDPNAANLRIVLREFELRAQGMSYQEIRKTVLAEGLLHGSKIKINAYYVSTIERRLSNKFYRGFFDWQGIEYRGKHPLIVPNQIIEIVQANKTKRGWKTKEKGVFSGGWIKCADPACGCALVYDGKIKKLKSTGENRHYHYYRCTNAKRVHNEQRGRNVSEAEIVEQFRPAVARLSITGELAEQIKAAMDAITSKHREANQKKFNDYRKVLDLLDAEQDSAYGDLKKSVIDEDHYQRIVVKVKEKRRYYTTLIEQCSDTIIESQNRTTQKIIELATNAESLWNARSTAEKVFFLKKVVSNPVLDGPTIRYDLQKPFEVIAQMSGNENWRPQRDSNSCIHRERVVS